MRKYSLLISVALVLVNIFLLLVINKQIKKEREYRDIIYAKSSENNLLSEGFFQFYVFNNKHINLGEPVITKKMRQTYFYELIKEKTLCVYIDAKSCAPCVYKELELLVKYREQYKIPIKIFIAGLNYRDFCGFISAHKIEDCSYLFRNEKIELFKYNPIVYFITNKNHKAEYFFTPNQHLPYISERYYKLINESKSGNSQALDYNKDI